MKKNSKADQKNFISEVTQFIGTTGATKVTEHDWRDNEYRMDTKRGGLYIYVDNEHDYCYTVFMRFDKPQEDLGNQYSGKHNMHSGYPVKESIERFKRFLNEAIK